MANDDERRLDARPEEDKEPFEDERLMRDIIESARAKKAFDIKALDLRGLASYTECFVIMSGGTVRQVGALAEGILQDLAGRRIKPLHCEGLGRSEWILLDFDSIVVHVFTPEKRTFYDLERLWADADEFPVARDEARNES